MTSPPARAAEPAPTAPAPLPARTHRTRPGPATRQTSLILDPRPTAPADARRILSTSLILWGLPHLQDAAVLIASELVTNAITASTVTAPPGTEPGPITIWVTARDGELCIRVWDADPTPPPRDQPLPDPSTLNGRGLILVSALSDRWGSHPAPNGGKYVWATLPLSAQPPAALAATAASPPSRKSTRDQPCSRTPNHRAAPRRHGQTSS
jgi:anti-sigma regulatory factor (Ser/Thr protein kinase)